MTSTKQVLILNANYWAGHKAAAEALNNYFNNQNYNCKIINIDDVIWNKMDKKIEEMYISMTNKPQIRNSYYNITDKTWIEKIIKYTIKIFNINLKKVDEIFQTYKPDILLATNFVRNRFLEIYFKKYGKNTKFWIIVTDSITIHKFRNTNPKYVDYFFVIDKYTKEFLQNEFKINKNQIIDTFFPIEPKYFVDKKQIWNKNIIILLTNLEQDTIQPILEKQNDKNILILKWRNEKLYKKLKDKFWHIKNYTFKEFEKIIKILPQYDLMISKSWWAITNECIATSTPIIIPNFIPWQEEGNKEFVEKSEIWIYEQDWNKINFLINYTNRNKMIPNFKKIKKNSCQLIFDYMTK